MSIDPARPDAPSMHIVLSSQMHACPTMNMSAGHYTRVEDDGKCNHGKTCGYADEFGGPCILPLDDHPKDRSGSWRHDDGRRNPVNTSVWVR
jgi:hypothetical protein